MLSSLPKHGPQGLTPSDQGLIQAASIVKALGVTDGASFEALMAALTVAESEGVGSQSLGEPRPIHPADAVTRLREFVEAENGGAGTASTIGLAGQTPSNCPLKAPPTPHHVSPPLPLLPKVPCPLWLASFLYTDMGS